MNESQDVTIGDRHVAMLCPKNERRLLMNFGRKDY